MRNLFITLVILFGTILGGIGIGQAGELTSEEESAELVKNLSDATIEILSSNANKQDKEAQIRVVLVENLDIERIGLLIAGKAIRKATPEQKAQYKPIIQEYIEIKYSKLLGGYNGQSITILSTGRAGKSDALVNTHIVQDSNEPVSVSWRVSNKRKKLMVLDVVVEGISMLRTERQQFEAVLQSKKFDGLIESLEKKVADMVAAN